jgi:hypothetical protein
MLAQGKGQATTAATTPVGMYQAIKSLSYLFYARSLMYAKDTHLFQWMKQRYLQNDALREDPE